MTRIELMRENKAQYERVSKLVEAMPDGFEKDVATAVTLLWIKGTNWMGGLDSATERKSDRMLKDMGYDTEDFDVIDRIMDEFHRQQEAYGL